MKQNTQKLLQNDDKMQFVLQNVCSTVKNDCLPYAAEKNNRNVIDQFCCRTMLLLGLNTFTEIHTHTHTHTLTKTHTEPSGGCLRGGQIKYLFTLSGERLDRAPLILSLWEPLVPWITLSLGAPRQTSGHAPLRSKPRHRPHQLTTSPEPPPPPPPSLTHPCTTGGGGGTRDRVDVRDKAWREGGDGERWRE